MTYFLDANILSYVIKQVPSVKARLRELIVSGNTIKIPVVTFYEVKRGLGAQSCLAHKQRKASLKDSELAD